MQAKPLKISPNISYVGKIDWELTTFHGEDFSTHHGSSYNSFLIEDEKTVLIDTVWTPFAVEFVHNLEKVIDLQKIDAIVMNHCEPDHSGALPELMRRIPNVPIYCSANAVKSLRGQYHSNWNLNVMKTGDRLPLGKDELIFVEMTMLHWPDSMLCYLTNQNILFSNDAFGQHYAATPLFNDLVDQCQLWDESLKYYANILQPFNQGMQKKLAQIMEMNLPIEIICPSHGIIWRKNPMQIVEKYLAWCQDYQEHQITIAYDSMWGTTRNMAHAIGEGIAAFDPSLTVKIHSVPHVDNSDVAADVFKSKAIAIGSSTINNGMLSPLASLLKEITGLRFKGKKALAFGSHGWSGEGARDVHDSLAKSGFEMIADAHRQLWMPNDDELAACFELGQKLAASVQ